jgi:hypothetical protein
MSVLMPAYIGYLFAIINKVEESDLIRRPDDGSSNYF